ncbi:MAG: trypsin-like peptidase domain-containing protein [Planctomycetota bacterium]|nr:trypsin-like peptidase domain-containing protein [Planctomycetota bacterium]
MPGALALLLLVPFLAVEAPPPQQLQQLIDDVDLDTLIRIEKKVREIVPIAMEKTVAVRVRMRGQVGFGSGAHIGDGFILTCAHVVELADSTRIDVILADGTEHRAELLGMNRLNDYALIRIEDTDFPAFDVERPSYPEVGDWVGALGHPGGPYSDSQPAFSLGQVTGLNRRLPLGLFGKQYTQAIQTNAQIFGGNSGGPLIDLEGRLLGINGAILLLNENSYAVPLRQISGDIDAMKGGEDVVGERIDDILGAFRELSSEISEDDWERQWGPFLGKGLKRFLESMPKEPRRKIHVPDVSRIFRELEKLFGDKGSPLPLDVKAGLGVTLQESDDRPGIRIGRVLPGGGADRAGLRAGDRIMAIDGKTVTSERDLQGFLSAHQHGDEVEVSILREGWTNEIEVTLQERALEEAGEMR